MAKRFLDCCASDFAKFTKEDLLESIRKSEGRVLACETIGTVPSLGVEEVRRAIAAAGDEDEDDKR